MTGNINFLHPDLKPKALEWLSACYADNLNVRIIQTWRDPLYQDKLFSQGRTNPGPIVTYLKGSESLHCFTMAGTPAAKAFDFACFDENHDYISNGADPLYAQAGLIAVRLGLEYAGNWSHFKDYDHIQLAA